LDPDFQNVLDELVYQIGLAGSLVSMFPNILKPFAVRYITGIEKPKKVIWEKLGALAKEWKPESVCPPPPPLSRILTDRKNANDHFSFGLAMIKRNQGGPWTLDQLISNTCIEVFAAFHTTATVRFPQIS
jgi:hypothetical protein